MPNTRFKGKVTDSRNGSPLSGASVKVKGTDKGVSAGADGTFTIDAPKQEVVLEVSIVGFLPEDCQRFRRSASFSFA